jgi:hypothetical protein
LAALVAATATESAGAIPSAAIIAAPTEAVIRAAATATAPTGAVVTVVATTGTVVTAATTATVPAGAASTIGLAVTPLEAAAAIIGAVVSVRAASPGFTGAGASGSTSGAATMVYKPRRLPVRQRLSYTLEHGFTTFVAHLRARSEVRLPLPFQFVDTLGKHPLTRAMVEEGSGGQPLYPIEILHDDQGKSYLTDGWAKFFKDYDLKVGWSLIFTCRVGSPFLCTRIVDTSGCTRAYSPCS